VRAAERAARADDAFRLQGVLDRHGHAMKSTLGLATGQRGIRLGSLPARRLGRQLDDGVELRIDDRDAVQVRLDHLAGTQAFGPDGIGKFAG
jgi:hypothetical protein